MSRVMLPRQSPYIWGFAAAPAANAGVLFFAGPLA